MMLMRGQHLILYVKELITDTEDRPGPFYKGFIFHPGRELSTWHVPDTGAGRA